MHLRKVGNSLYLYHDNEYVANITKDRYLQSYFETMKNLQTINIQKAQLRHEGTLIMKALKEFNSEFIEIENLIGTGKTEITSNNKLGGFDEIVEYVEKNYCEGKNVPKHLTSPSEITAQFAVKEANLLTRLLGEVRSGKVAPQEINESLKKLQNEKTEALGEFFVPKEITPSKIIEKKDTDKPITWADIRARERYERREKLKKFLDSFPKTEGKSEVKKQAMSWSGGMPERKLREKLSKGGM